jgi:hypothetical protein
MFEKIDNEICPNNLLKINQQIETNFTINKILIMHFFLKKIAYNNTSELF